MLRCEEGRGFFQDLALLDQDPVLAAQLPELVALLAGQPVLALPAIELGLLAPVAQGLGRDAQFLRDDRERSARGALQLDRVGSELSRIRFATLDSHADLLGAALGHTISGCPRERVNFSVFNVCDLSNATATWAAYARENRVEGPHCRRSGHDS